MSMSADGMLLCTTADDKSLKVFDVLNFGKHQFATCINISGYTIMVM